MKCSGGGRTPYIEGSIADESSRMWLVEFDERKIVQYKAEYLCHSRELRDTKGKKWVRNGKPTTQISPSEKLIERKAVLAQDSEVVNLQMISNKEDYTLIDASIKVSEVSEVSEVSDMK